MQIKSFNVSSGAFADGAPIPQDFSCEGENISPPLEWSDYPEGAQAFALICEDPDAPSGTWVHWVIYDIPGSQDYLPEGIAPDRVLENGALQGMNSWRRVGYGGPCPPGGRHRYFFRVYALDAPLGLKPGVSNTTLLEAMAGHILGEGALMGTYQKSATIARTE
jgi:Raf kinase inhibitor-like YbhB/YbcL family protein